MTKPHYRWSWELNRAFFKYRPRASGKPLIVWRYSVDSQLILKIFPKY